MKNGGNIVKDRFFSVWMIILCLSGLVINVVFAKLTLYFELPLFLDNIGSILVAALGGALPGVTVGFVSNILSSLTHSISMYYGILTVFIALVAAVFSSKGWLKTIKGCLFAAACFVVIGGMGGSCMTWMLYGGGIGEGISSPYAYSLLSMGFPVFWAQFIADVIIDIFDKVVTMIPVFLFLKFYPKKLYNKFALSYLYDRSSEKIASFKQKRKSHYKKMSVHTKILSLIIVCLIFISIISTTVGVALNINDQFDLLLQSATNNSAFAASFIDGNELEKIIEEDKETEEYLKTKQMLTNMYKKLDVLKYLYVYQIKKDGCHVIFDVDSPDFKGDTLGTIRGFEKAFMPYKQALLDGEEIEPIVSDGEYGKLITAYSPIKNSKGETVAYAGTDISVDPLITSTLSYIIRMISMQFGLSIIIVTFAVWFAKRKFVLPIIEISSLSQKFDDCDPEEWLESDDWKNRTEINTGDEIEKLYETVCSVEENVANSVTKMRDTERRLRKSEELEKKNEELAAAIKYADDANRAKTDFYSRMSHDMRTPMNGIFGLVELSKDETDINVLHQNIEKIGESSGYLLGLINDTLDMSKIESNKFELHEEVVYAGDFLQSLIDMVLPAVKQKNISLNLENDNVDTDVYISLDPLRVKQIFMNLVSNAVKFTPDGGMITFRIHYIGTSNGYITDRFILSDTGVGMSEDFIKNEIFTPFSQEQNLLATQYAGTGLGLAIVKRIVELMKGKISVESRLGEGTTFTVDLDFKIIPKSYVNKTKEKLADAENYESIKGKRVLLCEDHPLNAQIAVKLLDKKGVTTEHAENGQIGLDMFKSSEKGYYDAVLMDIRMPAMDGLEATEKIRSCGHPDAKTIPIIAMTANAFDDDIRKCKSIGMNDHLAKPIDVNALYEMIMKYCK